MVATAAGAKEEAGLAVVVLVEAAQAVGARAAAARVVAVMEDFTPLVQLLELLIQAVAVVVAMVL